MRRGPIGIAQVIPRLATAAGGSAQPDRLTPRRKGKDHVTFDIAIMYFIAALLTAVGAWMLWRLRRPTITERKTYAYRMVGIMLTSAGIVLAMSATAMWSWSTEG